MKPVLTTVLTLAMVLVLGGCNGGGGLEIPGLGRKLSDEDQISAILDKVHRGMETKKVYQIMPHVSQDYMDLEGRDYEGIRTYLNQIMKNYRAIVINRTPPTILVEGDRARAVEAFGTQTESGNSSTPPLNLQGHVSIYLQREAGGWKIVEWGSIG